MDAWETTNLPNITILRLDPESQPTTVSKFPESIKKFLEGLRDESAEAKKYIDFTKWRVYLASAKKDVLRVDSGYRSFSEQSHLYNKGRFNIWVGVLGGGNPEKIVTDAKPGDSFHNWFFAVDIIFTKVGYDGETIFDYVKYTSKTLKALYIASGIVAFAKSCGLRWGGDSKLSNGAYDVSHFEYGHLPPADMRVEANSFPGWWEANPEMLSSKPETALSNITKSIKISVLIISLSVLFLLRRKK